MQWGYRPEALPPGGHDQFIVDARPSAFARIADSGLDSNSVRDSEPFCRAHPGGRAGVEGDQAPAPAPGGVLCQLDQAVELAYRERPTSAVVVDISTLRH